MRRSSARSSGTGRPAAVNRSLGSTSGSASTGGSMVVATPAVYYIRVYDCSSGVIWNAVAERSLERPLTARSVVASILLGSQPPSMPGRLLVRAGELFGIAEGTLRVALSRMVAAGELEADGDGRYQLAGRLLDRQARQDQSRRPPPRRWSGQWVTAVVTTDGRSAADRAALRQAMRERRMGELREGVWLRPDNLGAVGTAPPLLTSHCTWFTGRPQHADGKDLAASLWDLARIQTRTDSLLERMAASIDRLHSHDTTALAPCFTLAAAALRH